MVKVDIISGFLGAGKTTLIKKLFTAKLGKERIALIENEFGQIGIDSSFLKESGIKIKEINSGCICCSLVGNFEKSLKEMIDTYTPERIIIEPSGVGKLSDIVNAINNTGLDLKVNILCTVVDGTKCNMYLKNFGEFYIDQIQKGNTIVISRSDKMTEEKIEEVVEKIREYNENAKIITTPISLLSGEKLFETLEENVTFMEKLIQEMVEKYKEEKHHHHHHEDGEECDDPECECHHHHDDDDDDEEEEHHHHHEDGEECDDPECECHHHHDDDDDDEEEEHHHHHHHGHDADEVFESVGIETSSSFTKEGIENILNELESGKYGFILRAKGVVKAKEQGEWHYFDYVPGTIEVRTGEPDVIGKMCVIGTKINKSEIKNLLKGND